MSKDPGTRIELGKGPGGRLELKKAGNEGQVRESFSKGRSKAVAVEVKRRRAPPALPADTPATELKGKTPSTTEGVAGRVEPELPAQSGSGTAPGKRGLATLPTLTDDEKRARLRALTASKKKESQVDAADRTWREVEKQVLQWAGEEEALQKSDRLDYKIDKAGDREFLNIPVFGRNIYPVQDDLVFVLMPFEEELTKIYNEIIKPAVQSINLKIQRADDITSNNAIILDIWKSICEAKIILADTTDLNPNVMYELGIAHAIGKETIIISQEKEHTKYPFDIAHIRRINYKNNMTGAENLRKKILETIKHVVLKLDNTKEKS